MPRGKRPMSGADLGDDDPRGGAADAGDSSSRSTAAWNGAISASSLASTAAMSALVRSMRSSIVASRKA
jgi:hypothetical protein